jgi:hypothetical protein
MDPTTAQILIAALGVVGAGVGAYVSANAAVKAALAVLEQRVKVAEEEIRGLRESRHHVSDSITAVQLEVMRMREK